MIGMLLKPRTCRSSESLGINRCTYRDHEARTIRMRKECARVTVCCMHSQLCRADWSKDGFVRIKFHCSQSGVWRNRPRARMSPVPRPSRCRKGGKRPEPVGKLPKTKGVAALARPADQQMSGSPWCTTSAVRPVCGAEGEARCRVPSVDALVQVGSQQF
jgi:hypothetical protein